MAGAVPTRSARGGARAVRFVLDGAVHVARDFAPTRTVLEYLREDLGRTGTKEGCAEGDCGACTVVVGELDGARVRLRAVNACIQFLPTLDGKALFTVESLRNRASGALHPVQQALADGHGSQCGFCTPGFVMSLFALYKTDPAPDRAAVTDALAGNLCRCTGYRPIVAAAQSMYVHGRALPPEARDWVATPAAAGARAAQAGERALARSLARLVRREGLVLPHASGTFHAPRTVAELAALRARLPDARLLAGGTDVGLWVTKQRRDLGDLIYVGSVAELRTIEAAGAEMALGAAVPLTDAAAALVQRYPEFGELVRRFASPPIRNAGTLAGNVANGSPIGDTIPPLIALGARVVLRRAEKTRELPLEDLYLAYQKTALAAGEFVERVVVPARPAGLRFAAYKVSKRFDQDISAVCAGLALVLEDGRIVSARVAFGGMAATPRRAPACEAALAGATWNDATSERAAAALAHDYQPISDMRASAHYRLRVAQNLLRRFHLETTGALGRGPGQAPARLDDLREVRA
ncbi:MAG: xanthine dehydrogenase small subunit [Burkholderiales bacterium]|nr:xanthine dehydrogenase small subunit [Burkholderiales bacterium]